MHPVDLVKCGAGWIDQLHRSDWIHDYLPLKLVKCGIVISPIIQESFS